MSATWKGWELEVAKAFHSKREGPTGIKGPDVITEYLVVECKQGAAARRKLVAIWREAVAKRLAAGLEGRPLVVALSRRGLGKWLLWNHAEFGFVPNLTINQWEQTSITRWTPSILAAVYTLREIVFGAITFDDSPLVLHPFCECVCAGLLAAAEANKEATERAEVVDQGKPVEKAKE